MFILDRTKINKDQMKKWIGLAPDNHSVIKEDLNWKVSVFPSSTTDTFIWFEKGEEVWQIVTDPEIVFMFPTSK